MLKKISIDVDGSGEAWLAVVRSILQNSSQQSMIDLCCCEATMTKQLHFKKRVYVDVIERQIGAHQECFVQADVLGDHPVLQDHYDVSICSDGIEHITKAQGFQLVERMKAISNKQILFTPIDAWMMTEETDTNPESHKSLWGPSDLPDFAHIVFPHYHPTLNIGAFFFWSGPDLDAEFVRVRNELEANPLFKGRISD